MTGSESSSSERHQVRRGLVIYLLSHAAVLECFPDGYFYISRHVDVRDNPPPHLAAARLCGKAFARAAFDALQSRVVAHVKSS